MSFIQSQGLRYFQFEIFDGYPFFHAVLTRHGGFSKSHYASLNTGGTVGDDPQDVLRNHQKIYQVLGYDYHSRLDVWQVHGTKIICGDSPRDPKTLHEKADGILTNQLDITLFMRFADCVPILLFDSVLKVIGIIHAGWQGTSQRITEIAIDRMSKCYGSNPMDIIAGIGPSICQECYEVGEEVFEIFSEHIGKKGINYFKFQDGRLFLDLRGANRDMLREAGVRKIQTADICTACNLNDWYSHRAEGGKTGRFGVLMALKDN